MTTGSGSSSTWAPGGGGDSRQPLEDDGFDADLFADLPTTVAEDPPVDPAARGGGWGPIDATAGIEDLLRQAVDMVASARRAPLSASVLLPRDDLLEVLQRALEALPDELRQARWLLRERQEFLAQRQREADDLIEAVRAQAERMVQRTEIVRQANQVAQRTVVEARDEARRLRHEAEEFCDKKLAVFEVMLERTARMVRAGRERLASVPTDDRPDDQAASASAPRPAAAPGPDRDPLFDQDSP